MLPQGLGVKLEKNSWDVPAIFTFLQEQGKIKEEEMYGVFNMGIGMSVVVSKQDANKALEVLKNAGEHARQIGVVIAEEGVHFSNEE